jgi:hypothetical protein
MGIHGKVPSYVETQHDIKDNERPEPGGSKIQIKTDEEEDKEQGDMDQHPREAIGGKSLCIRKWPLKIFTISFQNRHSPHFLSPKYHSQTPISTISYHLCFSNQIVTSLRPQIQVRYKFISILPILNYLTPLYPPDDDMMLCSPVHLNGPDAAFATPLPCLVLPRVHYFIKLVNNYRGYSLTAVSPSQGKKISRRCRKDRTE